LKTLPASAGLFDNIADAAITQRWRMPAMVESVAARADKMNFMRVLLNGFESMN
jgi:hypothetical protein